MGWDSLVSTITNAAQSAAGFGSGVASGVKGGATSLVDGVVALGSSAVSAAKATGRAAIDPAYRDQTLAEATDLARRAADYGGRLYDDPATRQQAWDTVQSAVGSIKDKYASARDAAAAKGQLPEFYGGLAGRGGFEVAGLLVPVTKLGALGKAGAAAEGAADLQKAAKVGEAMTATKAGALVTECAEVKAVRSLQPHPLTPSEIEKISAMPKGARPDPTSYLPENYIAEHLQQFDAGASRVMLESNFEKYGISQRDGTSFMMPSHELEQMLATAGNDARAVEDALGLPTGTLDNNRLVKIEVLEPREFGLRIPSGNEAGANDFWIPGGKLPDGNLEAVLDGASVPPDRVKVTPFGLK